jgi:hypothetical protein
MPSSANEIGRLVVTIGTDLSDFTKGMKDLQTGIRQAIGKDALSLSKDLAMGLTAAAAAAVGFAGASVMMSANMNETRIAFTSLMGSAEKASEFMNNLQEIEKSSPFKFEQLDGAARKLLAVGFTGEQIIPIFRTINDTVSNLKLGPEGLGELTSVFDKIMMTGSITNRELRTLKSAGIDAASMIAEKMGVSVPTALSLIKAGAVDSKTAITGLIEGMDKDFGGMAAKLANEIPHLFKRMDEDIRDIMITEGDKLQATGIGKFIKVIADDLDRVAVLVKTNGLFESLEKVFGKDMMSLIVAFSGAIAGGAVAGFIALAAATSAAWVPLLPWMALGAAVAGLAYLIWDNWRPILTWFQESWIGLKYYTMEFVIKLGEGFLWLAGVILDNAEKLFGWVPGLGDKIAGVKEKIVELKDNLHQADQSNWDNAKKQLDEVHTKAAAAAKSVKEIKPAESEKGFAWDNSQNKEMDYLLKAKQLEAQMKDAADNYDLQAYMKLLDAKNAAFLNFLEEQKTSISLYNRAILDANKTLASAGMDAIKSMYDGIAQSMWDVVTGTTTVVDALENMAKNIAQIFFKYGIEKLIGSMLSSGMGGWDTATPSAGSFGSSGSGIPMHGAGGHFTTPHLAVVGDKPETIIPDSDMADFLGGAGGGDISITNNVINQTGTPMQSTSSVQKTTEGFVINTVLKNLATNGGGLRTAVKAAAGG